MPAKVRESEWLPQSLADSRLNVNANGKVSESI